MIKKITTMLLLLAVALVGSAHNGMKYKNPTGKEFPILAWYSVLPDSNLTRERYMELREAGFNISFSHFNNAQELAKGLAASRGTGVKLMATCPELEKNTAEMVTRFKNEKMLCGWFLRDEPTTTSFADLRKFRDRVYNIDNKHLIYLNLLPNFVSPAELGTKSYEEYMQRSVDELGLSQISYDLYPIVLEQEKVIVRPQLYSNLEIARWVSMRSEQPFWAFVLTTAHGPYPIPTAAHLRIEAFSALAYGAQCIQHFTYWTPPTDTWNFHSAPIDEYGKRTPVYELVKNLNREIQSLSWVFLGAKAIAVGHTGSKTLEGTTEWQDQPAPVKLCSSGNEGVLVSHLMNRKNHFMMFVNHDIHHSQTIEIEISGKVRQVDTQGKLQQPCTIGQQQVTLAPGGYLLYYWK